MVGQPGTGGKWLPMDFAFKKIDKTFQEILLSKNNHWLKLLISVTN